MRIMANKVPTDNCPVFIIPLDAVCAECVCVHICMCSFVVRGCSVQSASELGRCSYSGKSSIRRMFSFLFFLFNILIYSSPFLLSKFSFYSGSNLFALRWLGWFFLHFCLWRLPPQPYRYKVQVDCKSITCCAALCPLVPQNIKCIYKVYGCKVRYVML